MNTTSHYPPPRLLFWDTTAGCNLHCIHCRRITVADKLLPQDMNTKEALALVDQITAFARPILVLSGGEPLYRPDIFEIAGHATASGLIVALATNGTMIDAGVAKEIKSSGYLPVEAGNVRNHSLATIWQDSPPFKHLRNPELLTGKCGGCEFKRVCSGCRDRAYGMTGDILGQEPFCTYQPGESLTESYCV